MFWNLNFINFAARKKEHQFTATKYLGTAGKCTNNIACDLLLAHFSRIVCDVVSQLQVPQTTSLVGPVS